MFLGPVDYVSHTGDRPIAITCRLRTPMSTDFFARGLHSGPRSHLASRSSTPLLRTEPTAYTWTLRTRS